MNILFFLTPKSDVAYIFEDETLRQTVEKMEHRKFSCIPILNKEGQYTGTISEGDLLWGIKLLNINSTDLKEMENVSIMAIPRRATYKPVHADADMEDLLDRAINQNYVPAEGCEAGGHIGELTTMVLVPQVADAVNIPVIAAGGIADGRGMAAAFMLGAKGIQMGTVFAASKESVIHENYKNSIIKAKDIDSRVTGRSTGHPIRVLRNDMVRRYLELEKAGAPFEELEQLTLGSLRKAVQEGDAKNGSLMAGQIAGMIKEERSCEDIIKTTVVDAGKLMNGVNADE